MLLFKSLFRPSVNRQRTDDMNPRDKASRNFNDNFKAKYN